MLNMLKDNEHRKAGDASSLPLIDDGAFRRVKSWLAECLRRGEHEVFTVEAELSPFLARLLLARNPDNRNVKEVRVADYAADIQAGNWQLNGESIKISRTGLLNDGQHRCRAVDRAGRSIRTLITFGVDRDTRLTLDQGAVRSPGDYLGMEGVENPNHAAAVASLLWQYEHLGRVSYQQLYRPTKAQTREAFHTHPGINDSIRVASGKGSTNAGGVSVLAFCHWVFAQRDREAATAFISRLIKGNDLSTKDPIYLCRERLHSDKRLKLEEKVELIFRAWNLHRKNKRLTKIQIMGALPVVER